MIDHHELIGILMDLPPNTEIARIVKSDGQSIQVFSDVFTEDEDIGVLLTTLGVIQGLGLSTHIPDDQEAST